MLRLPCFSEPVALRPEAAAETETAAPTAARVLIVEDNRDSAETLAELMGLWGHDVRIARTGQEAIDLAPEFQPAAILCDLGLPDMDGYAVARRLREETSLPDTWLIALTGYGQGEDRQRTQEAGFHVHLTKPVDLAALERLLRSAAGEPAPPSRLRTADC